MKYFFLFLIITVSLFLRLYKINSVPPSASLDEVSIGWNAYSILNTGKDEYGYSYPILLRAYDDYRPALYVYTVIPFVKVFGLEAYSVRLPSVIFAIGTILAAYFLGKNIFYKEKYKDEIGLLSALSLGLSPWNIYISRLGHEANAGLFFAVSGISFFISFVRNEKKLYLFLSMLCLVLALYTYQSEKVFAPLIVCALFAVFYKILLKFKKTFLFCTLIGFIFLIPLILSSLSGDALIRASGTSAFNTNQPIYTENFIKLQEAKKTGDILGQVIYQRRFVDVSIFVNQYISHFSPRWLFGNAGNDQFKAPKMGLINLWTVPFILYGVYYLSVKYKEKRFKYFLFLWLMVAFVPSAIATGAPHAMRSYNLLPVPQILAAVGMVYAFSLIRTGLFRKVYLGLAGLVLIYFAIFFFKQYFYTFPENQSSSFQYAIKEAMDFVYANKNNYRQVVISNRNNLHQSYMFYLFYSKYDPILYQKNGGTISGGFEEKHHVENILFQPIDNIDQYSPGTLFVGNIRNDVPRHKILKKINNLDGADAIMIYEN